MVIRNLTDAARVLIQDWPLANGEDYVVVKVCADALVGKPSAEELRQALLRMIRWKQAVDKFPDFGMTFDNPAFVEYAQSYGAKGTRVDAIGQFKQVLEAAFRGGVCIWSTFLDYSENGHVLA